ncbi:unnamed protein product, partial [marine sediment metagenome]
VVAENNNKEITYEGFVTPSLILEGSDTSDSGNIIDQYAKTKEQDGLICGKWSRGFEDKLIHIWLTKPVAAIIDEREGWVAKSMLLKEPISYMPLNGAETEGLEPVKRKATPKPKQRVVLDKETKQFRLV